MMRLGRLAPRFFCARCQVWAMVDPPAPMEKSSAPVLAKWSAGRKLSMVRPDEIVS
jgi:hypothetical protein